LAVRGAASDDAVAGDPMPLDAQEKERIVACHYAACVKELFDDYAPTFEESLVKGLEYRVPEYLAAVLGDGDVSQSCLVDVGCGTGLAGCALKARCRGKVRGCDVSKRMLQEAARLHPGVYDDLKCADAVTYLSKHVKPGAADLVVAADMMIYLRPLARAVERALCDGGRWAFSTEKASNDEAGALPPPSGNGWVERKTERIAHSEAYVRWVIDQCPLLRIISFAEAVVRKDAAKDLLGHMVVVEKVDPAPIPL